MAVSVKEVTWDLTKHGHPAIVIASGAFLSVFSFVVTYIVYFSLEHKNTVGETYPIALLSDTINHAPEHQIGAFLLTTALFPLALALLLRHMLVHQQVRPNIRPQ